MNEIDNYDDKPVRVAIIGYGLAGSTFHAPLVASVKGMDVAAIVTSNAKRQAQAHADHPAAKILNSADEIWNDRGNYDLVVIATTNETHAPLAITSMEAGIPVVIDKPMAISVEEAKGLIAKKEETGSLLSVFQNRRWDNDFLTVKKLIREDKLSAITRFESRFERYRPQPKEGGWREATSPDAGGGLLFDLGSHLIDQAIQLFGNPKSVYAEVLTRRPTVSSDDDTFVALQFDNGVVAHLWVSMLARIQGPRMRLLGMKGTYEKWGLDPQENQLKEGVRPGDAAWGKEEKPHWGRLLTDIDGTVFDDKIESETGCYETYYRLMRDAIRTGSPVPVDARDALKSLQIIAEARSCASA